MSQDKFVQDMLGNEIIVGGYVVGQGHGADLAIYNVLKFTPKFVSLRKVADGNRCYHYNNTTRKSANALVAIPSDLVTLYALSHPSK